ncbi:LysR family transcriptional regulator [Clostridioides difficile]|uniref:LysR family transcriptional regulator n=1 Tax=Clostridioides difficile TaxID=1496 RepID=UPI000BB19BC8|nr:LysR family transcriptional regulator [Clostridioides difficile]PBF70692.1 LysR family transcriptional regulator [Clostridioides difficile]
MNIKRELYKVFNAVVNNKSFSLAAKELFMSQPAVSQSIKQLEEQLDTLLFYRNNKGVKLTPEGKILSEHVTTALKLISSGEDRINKFKKLEYGSLKIGVGDTAARFFLLKYLEIFHKKYPHIHVSTINRTSRELISLLKDGNIDIAIINMPIEDDTLNIVECIEIHDIFVCANDYIEYKGRKISLEELNTLPLIMLENKANSRLYVNEYFLSKGIKLNPDIELGSHELLLEFAYINLGVSCVIEEFSIDYLENEKLFKLDIKEPIPKRNIGYCHLKDISLSLATKEFLSMISNNI